MDRDATLAYATAVRGKCNGSPTGQTSHLINRERLLAMKPAAILINTSRGGLVDEKALIEALQSRHLLGAGIDVYEAEPIDQNHPLTKIER